MSYTGVTCHKPNKKKRWNMSAIRWDKVAGNDKKRNAACKGCKHWDQHGDCSYILNEGHRRGVPINPGGGCEKKDTGVKVRGGEFILTDRQKRKAERAKQRDFDRGKAAELYEMGDNDVAISNKLGCKKWDILFWRQETGRPSNYRRKAETK